MKPTVKAPETKRLKLQHDIPLSNFAFNFHLRRYNPDWTLQQQRQTWALRRATAAAGAAAGLKYGQTIRGAGGRRNRSNRSAADEDDQDAIFDELPEVGPDTYYSLSHQPASGSSFLVSNSTLYD
jgi:hypothetical protein